MFFYYSLANQSHSLGTLMPRNGMEHMIRYNSSVTTSAASLYNTFTLLMLLAWVAIVIYTKSHDEILLLDFTKGE